MWRCGHRGAPGTRTGGSSFGFSRSEEHINLLDFKEPWSCNPPCLLTPSRNGTVPQVAMRSLSGFQRNAGPRPAIGPYPPLLLAVSLGVSELRDLGQLLRRLLARLLGGRGGERAYRTGGVRASGCPFRLCTRQGADMVPHQLRPATLPGYLRSLLFLIA